MATELETWQREHYAPGGGAPFLFYVIYGDIDPSQPLSRSKYRTNGAPEGLEVMSYTTNEENDVPGSFREGYLWDELIAKDPPFADQVAKCDQCFVFRGTPRDDTTLDYLRDTIGFITYLLDNGGVAVYDPLMFRWWRPAEWKTEIFEPAAPVPTKHTVILVSEEEDVSLKWYHTRGMRKFGRPDISVPNVSSNWQRGVVDLCNRLITIQALGHVVADEEKIWMEALPEGGILRHAGDLDDLDDPDFNNVHIKAIWPEPGLRGDKTK